MREGILFIGDPHLASTPPGQRLPGFTEQILTKVSFCLEYAQEHNLEAVILGDLFHWPRDNANFLLVALIRLFGSHRPWVLVGNHDKHLTRLTEDVSLSVLAAAGVIRLLDAAGPAFTLTHAQGSTLVGASPDGFDLPEALNQSEHATVIWITHHNIGFPDYEERQVRIREIPGVDWVINGHIHRPLPTVTKGQTRWANPGNITRLSFTQRTLCRIPAAAIWRPGCEDLEALPVPCLPCREIFPEQELPPEDQVVTQSLFLQGLERLAWRRTQEGVGIRRFLEDNLDQERPEAGLIWELYAEVLGERK